MIVIGDSVSIGYTPIVAAALNGSIQVQHSPASGGGGADDVGTGVACQPYFLRTAAYNAGPGTPLGSMPSWGLISFNFGLHNLNNAPSAEAEYSQLLVNFTEALQAAQPQAKLVYITTTPYMQYRFFGNMVVEQLNEIARSIMAPRGIPVIDLYAHVIDFCGNVYANCSICDNEYSNVTGVTCGYHYTPAGWDYLGQWLAPQYAQLLAGVTIRQHVDTQDASTATSDASAPSPMGAAIDSGEARSGKPQLRMQGKGGHP